MYVMYVCMYVMNVCNECMYVCMCVCVYVCMSVCLSVCMYVCMYVCVKMIDSEVVEVIEGIDSWSELRTNGNSNYEEQKRPVASKKRYCISKLRVDKLYT